MKYTYSNKQPQDAFRVRFFIDDQKSPTDCFLFEEKKKVLRIALPKGVMTRRKLILLSRKIIALSRKYKMRKIFLNLSDFSFVDFSLPESELGEILAISFGMANFEFVRYKTKQDSIFIEEIIVDCQGETATKNAFEKGKKISDEVNACRDLANTPGGEMTPNILAIAAKKAVKGLSVAVKILKRKEMEILKMGGVLGVAQGSVNEPRFIIMEYKAGGKESPVVLVGKGVTFDAGGLNLKSSNSIYEMHMDMSGGAAVIHTLVLAAKLGLKQNIIALVPAVENMPSGSSYRPGDILKSMSGKTIEVLDTDAEGRIILADALTYAEKYNPKLVVDVATLTGAAVVALGERASALFTKDEKLEKLFRDLGEVSGDYVWPLPLWEEYEEEIRGTFGDFANLGKTKYGGSITAAIFLAQFAQKYPWVHLDIAPRMTALEGEYLSKGAVGAPVRLLLKILESFEK
jgi:leucyl aminopeptidase